MVAVEKRFLWDNGQTIRVKFLGGTVGLHNIVKKAAKEWEKYANITFSFILDGHSDIRISFIEGKGSYSMIGTKALEAQYTGLSTMNLDIIKQGSSIQFSTVLHELGHVLGCIHEHRSPAANIQWNLDAVYAHYYASRGWNRQRVDENVLRTYPPEEIQCSSSADFNSIMMYDFHQSLANGPLPTNPNLQLSIEDRKFIAEVYPNRIQLGTVRRHSDTTTTWRRVIPPPDRVTSNSPKPTTGIDLSPLSLDVVFLNKSTPSVSHAPQSHSLLHHNGASQLQWPLYQPPNDNVPPSTGGFDFLNSITNSEDLLGDKTAVTSVLDSFPNLQPETSQATNFDGSTGRPVILDVPHIPLAHTNHGRYAKGHDGYYAPSQQDGHLNTIAEGAITDRQADAMAIIGSRNEENISQLPLVNEEFADSGYASTTCGAAKQLEIRSEQKTEGTGLMDGVDLADQMDTTVLAPSDYPGCRGNRGEKDEVESIYSDTSSIPSLRKGYINELADELAQAVDPYKPNNDVLQRIFRVLPELLKAFSLSLGQSLSSQMHRDVMVFIHRYRRDIVATFREYLSEREIESRECRNGDEMSLHDIMSLWHQKDEAVEPESPGDIGYYEPEESDEVGQTGEDGLPGLAAYRRIIQNSPTYTWLLDNVRRECILAPPEPNLIGEIRKSILKFLPMSPQISRQKPAEIFDVSFKIHWDPVKFLMEEGYAENPEDVIEGVITLTGSATSAQALTCGEYMRQAWPSTGMEVLKLMKALVSRKNKGSAVLPDGTRLDFSIRPSIGRESSFDVWVDARGTGPVIAEIGEQVAWLASALRSSPFEHKVACSRPFIDTMQIGHVTYEQTARVTYIYEIGVEVYEVANRSEIVNGECWHNLFGMPLVVEGFPIRRRPEEHSEGLEIPLNIMAALAETRRANCFDEKILLKGFSTMLIPTKYSQDTVTWHLVYQRGGKRISYLESEQFTNLNIGVRQLEKARHIVGWCPEIKFYAGEADASYNIRNSGLSRPSRQSVLNNASLSTGHIVTGGAAFSIGRKDSRLHRNSYIRKIRWISQKYVTLWDVGEKRGWLVNGASALLHLVRASLNQDQLDSKFSSLCLFTDDEFQEASRPHQSDSALEVLLNQNNLKVKVYPEDDGHIYFKDRVEDFYDFLEKTIDYQVKAIGIDGKAYKQPRSLLDGWDFSDLAMERDPIYPRRMILDQDALSWVDFARSIHTVTLFGRGFGEVILPTTAYCSPWVTLPHGRSYLAASVADLYNIMDEYGDPYSKPMRLTHDVLWCVVNGTLTRRPCDGKTDETHSDLSQVLLPLAMRRELPKTSSICPEISGAVIFGYNSGNQWFWGDVGYPSRTPNQSRPVSLYKEMQDFTSDDSGIGRSLGSSASKGNESMTRSDSFQWAEECHDHSYTVTSEPEDSTLAGSRSPGSKNNLLSAEDYKTGIVCALYNELMAVRALFDKTFEKVHITDEDPNYYALGCIGRHNIVAVCLPHGAYGTNPAANVASNMKRSFPALRFCLLVGVGAGVPSEKNDIRLGDVVVSTPTGSYSGVLPYDMIKSLESGASQLNGYLCPPPGNLMCAISELESDPVRSSTPLQEYLYQIEARKAQYKHPGVAHDRLFASHYIHNSNHDSCDQCDPACEITRTPRSSIHPEIHYGLMASGNQVMKSAEKRDKLSQEHNVLCFEMEGAGIMNSFPCLVIRGICDYADSHKNKRWQNYAAATAAAYAKLLLYRLRTPDSTSSAFEMRESQGCSRKRPPSSGPIKEQTCTKRTERSGA